MLANHFKDTYVIIIFIKDELFKLVIKKMENKNINKKYIIYNNYIYKVKDFNKIIK